jgi:protein-disulfide isomerase
VQLVLKNYPYRYRDYARIAAQAALAAGDQGKYWEMHDILLDRSPMLDRASLVKYAGELGLDLARFQRDLDGVKHKDLIDADIKLAESLDIYNTPTFFINGRKVVGNAPYEYLKKIVEEELKNAGSPKALPCGECHLHPPVSGSSGMRAKR